MIYEVELYVDGVQKTRIRVPVIRRWKLQWGYIDLGEKPFAKSRTYRFEAPIVREVSLGPVRLIVSAIFESVDWAAEIGGFPLFGGSKRIMELPHQETFKGRWPEGGILSIRGDIRIELV